MSRFNGGSRSRRGLTLTEVLFVTVLALGVIGTGTLLLSRTRAAFTRGGEMLDLQQTLKVVVERLRSDIRALTVLEECSGQRLAFLVKRDGRDTRVEYRFDPLTRTLKRRESPGSVPESDFHAAGRIEDLRFEPRPSAASFAWIGLSFSLAAEVRPGHPPARMAFSCLLTPLGKEDDWTGPEVP